MLFPRGLLLIAALMNHTLFRPAFKLGLLVGGKVEPRLLFRITGYAGPGGQHYNQVSSSDFKSSRKARRVLRSSI
jgi:hypothetical protein